MVLDQLPSACTFIADSGYDSAWVWQALDAKGITPCIFSSRSRNAPFPYDKDIHCQRHRVENLFAKLKRWRCLAVSYDHTFFLVICLAATVIF